MIRRTPLRRVSTKRAAQLKVYAKKRKAYLEAHPFCEVQQQLAYTVTRESAQLAERIFGAFQLRKAPIQATDIHHKAGRVGEKLNDERYFMAVSRQAHDWIHSHGKEARARGWLI